MSPLPETCPKCGAEMEGTKGPDGPSLGEKDPPPGPWFFRCPKCATILSRVAARF